jgi:steroid delta-isomerase-like uncharacterized protein
VDLDGLIDRWEAAWSGHQAQAFVAICAPDVQYEDPLTDRPLRGPDELAAHALRLWSGIPDARLERTGERLTDGRFAVAPSRLLGTHRGELDGLPASGKEIVVQVCCYVELDHRELRLWRVRAFFDLYAAGVTIGVLPRRGTVASKALLVLRGYGLRLPRP